MVRFEIFIFETFHANLLLTHLFLYFCSLASVESGIRDRDRMVHFGISFSKLPIRIPINSPFFLYFRSLASMELGIGIAIGWYVLKFSKLPIRIPINSLFFCIFVVSLAWNRGSGSRSRSDGTFRNFRNFPYKSLLTYLFFCIFVVSIAWNRGSGITIGWYVSEFSFSKLPIRIPC
jgi:hypothetical protein